MGTKSRILRMVAALVLISMMVTGMLGGLTALAVDVWDAGTYNPTDEVTLLAGNGADVRGDTLSETIANYRSKYLMGVAADFCVFLEKDFWVTESDAEGRVAVGGDIIVDVPWSFGYTIGAGDFHWKVPLEELLVTRDEDGNIVPNRVGAATVILGGDLYGNINDAYYSSYEDTMNIYGGTRVKFEGPGNGLTPPDHSSKKLTVVDKSANKSNSENNFAKGLKSYWGNVGRGSVDNSIPQRNTRGDWQKVDITQTYVTNLLSFSDSFSFLDAQSSKMKQVVDEFKVEFDQGSNKITFTYLGDSSIARDCVYLNLTGEDLQKYINASFIEFKNIPELLNTREIIDIKARSNGKPDDEVYMETWTNSYIVINVAGSDVHLASLDIDNGQKFTSINGKFISRTGPSDRNEANNNLAGVTSILYNFYEADNVYLGNNFQGTIFAPGADVTDEFTDQKLGMNDGHKRGHLSGALIAKSFKGATEFGYRPFTGTMMEIQQIKGELKVLKTVQGNVNEPDKEFHFRIVIDNDDIVSIAGDPVHTFGDITFTKIAGTNQSEATFTLKAGESKLISGLPIGTKYTVYELDANEDGYTTNPTSGKIEGVIEKESSNGLAPKIAEFVNTKNIKIEYGKLTLSKTVSGNSASTSKEFSFTVILKDASGNPVSATIDGVTFTNGRATFKLKHGDSKTIENIPAGYTYEVIEDDAGEYIVSPADGKASGTITADGEAKAAFVNTLDKFGVLKVAKTVSGNAGDPKKEFTFTVTLKDAKGNPVSATIDGVTFTNGKASFKLKHGETKEIKNIPAGYTYEVTEDDAGDYIVSPSDGKISGSITADGTATAAFVNTLNKEEEKFGSLTVKKSITGTGADKTKKFHFTITLEGSDLTGTYNGVKFENGVAKVELGDGDTVTITNLPAGLTYKVTEDDAGEYISTPAGGASGTITENGNEIAEFVNTLNKEEEKFGSLTVKKSITGTGADKTKKFHFTITLEGSDLTGTYNGVEFEGGVAKVELGDGDTITITNLPAGLTYKVAEDDAGEYISTPAGGASGTITENGNEIAEFVNTLNKEEEKFGSLTVKKSITGTGADKTKKFHFTITLEGSDLTGTYNGVKFENGVAKVELGDGDTVTITNLPAGLTYKVTEDDAGEYISTPAGGASGTITENGIEIAEFVNTLDEEGKKEEKGSLTIRKTVENGAAANPNDTFTFTITINPALTGTADGVKFVNGVATITLKGGESKTINDLPAGLTYKVEEEPADGYDTTATGTQGTILDGVESQAEFINTFTGVYGNQGSGLRLEKRVQGTAGNPNQEFTFVIKLGQSINGTYSGVEFKDGVATVKLKHGDVKLIRGLPAGVSYEVQESDYGDYEVSSTNASGNIPNGDVAEVLFINTRNAAQEGEEGKKEEKGSLTIRKTVKGDLADPNDEFTFVITIEPAVSGTADGVKFENGKATITLKGGQSRTINDLPAGLTYKVEEVPFAGYNLEGASNTQGTIINGVDSRTEFINARYAAEEKAYGDLCVIKTVTGTAGDLEQEFHFTVTLSDKSISGNYGEMTFENGVASFTLTSGDSKTAAGLPAGVRYEVVEQEANKDGYSTTAKNNSGSIPANDQITAGFVNAKNAATAPKTGDSSHPMLYTAMILAAIIGLIIIRRRANETK